LRRFIDIDKSVYVKDDVYECEDKFKIRGMVTYKFISLKPLSKTAAAEEDLKKKRGRGRPRIERATII
jgi:hypothetical protein